MSTQGWPDARRTVESSDGRESNPPVQGFFQAFTNHALGELKLWIEQEFNLGGGGGEGIQFNLGTYGPENVGDWLSVETSSATDSGPNAYGLELGDCSTGGIHIVERYGNGGPLILEMLDDGGIQLLNTHNGSSLTLFQEILLTPNGGQDVKVHLPATSSFVIEDHTNTPVFQVDEDGTITPSGGGGGIQFGTDPQNGSYLFVKATSGSTIHGFGIELVEDTGNGIALTSKANSETALILGANGQVNVYDSGGNPIFRVDENGDLHGKTGKALTFDL